MFETTIKLDKERHIVLGFRALQEFKRVTGKSLMGIDFENVAEADLENVIPAIFYAGLKWEDKDLTLDEVTDLIDEYLGFQGATELLPKIIEDAFGKQDKAKNLKRQK